MPALQWRTIKRQEHRQLVALIGPITHETAATLRGCLDRTIGAGTVSGPAVDLILDLHCCTNIDTQGLLAPHVAQQTARTRGGDLHLIHVPPLIQRLINQHNLEHLIQPDPD